MKTAKKLLVAASMFVASMIAAAEQSTQQRDAIYTPSVLVKTEGNYQENPRFLNKQIPDKYGFFKTTVDIKNRYLTGTMDSDIPAIEGYVVFRHKSVMGSAGKTDLTDSQNIKLGDAYMGDIRHNSSKPVLWLREGWFKACLNPILGFSGDDVHSIKVGMFGHSVGRGIAMGSEYGMSKDFLAVYNAPNDFCAPGILLSGVIPGKKLTYNAYIGLLENKSSSIKDTFNTLKTNQIGKESAPWSGTGNNNTLYALSFIINAIDNGNMKLDVSPYIVFNRALDQQVDVAADSESNLGSYGANIDFQQNNWGFNAEAAANFGSEKLYSIDRNVSKIYQVGEDTKSKYTHIQESVSGQWVQAKTYAELQTALRTNRHLTNGEQFTVSINGTPTSFRSASNRIRPAYENKYRGFMGMLDTFYKLGSMNAVFSTAAGFLSGGSNPHASETNKNYRGFVAIHEYYTGKYVTSAFMFDTRTIKRPLVFEPGASAVEDGSLTDLVFAGYGFTWNPESYKHKKLTWNANMLYFFKELASYKVIKNDDGSYTPSTTEFARSFMGTEVNSVLSFEPVKGMTVSLKAAAFFPGTYYQDIKGIALPGDVFSKLDATDTQNIDSAAYRLSTDTAYNSQIAVEYRF